MKKILIFGLIIILIGVVVWLSRGAQAPSEMIVPTETITLIPTLSITPSPTASPRPTASVKKTQGVEGTVKIGPTCPVEKTPPDPACADKPYQTTVLVFDAGKSGSTAIAQAKTNSAGYFKITLPAGFYIVQAEGGQPWPHCSSWTGAIVAGEFKKLALNCDSGIR